MYSISVMYRISVEDIYRLNPESKNIIRAGDKLKIPQQSGSYLYHTIQPKETLYALSQKYKMRGEDIVAVNPGLSVETFQIGKIIRIPINQITSPIQGGNEEDNSNQTNSLLSKEYPGENMDTIKVALLLPFETESNTNLSSPKLVEYLEGFLLALEDFKKKDVNVKLYMFDTGMDENKIPGILKKSEMQDIHLLIGGLFEEQIKLMARFAGEKNIPYVIPLSPQSDEPYNNPNIYQVNTPTAKLFSKASLACIKKYKNDNIILVTNKSSKPGNSDFINILRDDLQQQKIGFNTVSIEDITSDNFAGVLSVEKRNIFIPTNDYTKGTISGLINPLESILAANPEYKISLFGYPDWQAFHSQYSDDFFLLNTSFFTVFYADPTSAEVKSFYSNFYKWYSKILIYAFPKYGILGYDTGMYFIQLLNKFGTSFDKNINRLDYHGIQIDFHFERVNNWAGFINTNLYVVDFNSDYSITKTVIN
ncbi:peptidase M23 [Bacteroidia bacterium]|nr:peptidase M23 [Bacteroidia bacterium]